VSLYLFPDLFWTLTYLSRVIISTGRTPGQEFTFNALDFYRTNKSLFGVNTLTISFAEAVEKLTQLKKGFEQGTLRPPAVLEEVDLADGGAVLAAYEKAKAGAKAKQILVNKNLWIG
jgi:NADPH:quinone reductase